jgi:hypothetical protein
MIILVRGSILPSPAAARDPKDPYVDDRKLSERRRRVMHITPRLQLNAPAVQERKSLGNARHSRNKINLRRPSKMIKIRNDT